jgi:hypothetical protein
VARAFHRVVAFASQKCSTAALAAGVFARGSVGASVQPHTIAAPSSADHRMITRFFPGISSPRFECTVTEEVRTVSSAKLIVLHERTKVKDTAQMLLKNRLSAASDYANRIGSLLFPVREAKCS